MADSVVPLVDQPAVLGLEHRQGVRVAGRHQQPGLAVVDGVREAADGRGDDGLAVRLGEREDTAPRRLDVRQRHDARAGEEALAILRRAAEEHANDGATFYDLACMEAMTGEHDAAVEHLGQAIAIRPAAREWAQDDAELDPIRDRPDFPA